MPNTGQRKPAPTRAALLFSLGTSLFACGSPLDSDTAPAGGPVSSASIGAAVAALPGGQPSWATPQNFTGMANPADVVDLQVHLRLRDKAAAQAELDAISDPESPRYEQFLTTEEFRAKYAPQASDVEAVISWLRSQGLSAGYVPENNLFVTTQGTVQQVEALFGTRLGLYHHDGRTLRAPVTAPTLPTALLKVVSAVPGLHEAYVMPRIARVSGVGGVRSSQLAGTHKAPTVAAGDPIPPPPGSRGAPPCTRWFGELTDTKDPPYGGGFPAHLSYAPCGYKPPQLRAAYGLADAVRKGNDGHGVTVAIVDAFEASPNLFRDAQTYSAQNDPDYPLTDTLFKAVLAPGKDPTFPPSPGTVQGWWGEQTLDVEAVHATAPGAKVLFVGARDNSDANFVSALNDIIDKHQATVISNSWGSTELETLNYIAFEAVAIQAGLKGIGVYFSSGDNGDFSGVFGIASAGFPASLPQVTAVGGTTLAVGRLNDLLFEQGWQTGASTLTPAMGMTPASWSPPAPGGFVFGGGGGTSSVFLQPDYQKGVVPPALATVNGPPARVIPDVAMLADPFTGFLEGITQTFPEGVSYGEYPIGGTSVACPLFAGVVALAEQKHKHALGFINPKLYKLPGSAFRDIVPGPKQGTVAVIFNNQLDATQGTTTIAATFDLESQSLKVTRGYDNMTGRGAPNGANFLRGF